MKFKFKLLILYRRSPSKYQNEMKYCNSNVSVIAAMNQVLNFNLNPLILLPSKLLIYELIILQIDCYIITQNCYKHQMQHVH